MFLSYIELLVNQTNIIIIIIMFIRLPLPSKMLCPPSLKRLFSLLLVMLSDANLLLMFSWLKKRGSVILVE